MSENTKKEIISWALHIIVPIVAVLLLNAYICKIAIVNGESMYPSLYDHDILLIQKIFYQPKQGDIVVLDFTGMNITRNPRLVKRVIATEGQTVRIDYDENSVAVDGAVLDEPYINLTEADPMKGGGSVEYQVPEGCIFVLGDNRNHSSDSRAFGMVRRENVMGGSFLRLPIGKWFAPSE